MYVLFHPDSSKNLIGVWKYFVCSIVHQKPLDAELCDSFIRGKKQYNAQFIKGFCEWQHHVDFTQIVLRY